MTTRLTYQSGSEKTVPYDVCVSERFENVTVVTEHPVERGSNITDHLREENARVSLEVFVSNHPHTDSVKRGKFQNLDIEIPEYRPPLLPTPGSLTRNAVAAVGDLLSGGAPKPVTLQFPEEFNRVQELEKLLSELRAKGQLFRVISHAVEVDGLILERVTLHKDGSTGDGANFSLDLRRIRIVETKQVGLPVPQDLRAVSAVAAGAKAVQAASDLVGKKQSLLRKALDGLGVEF